MPSLTLEEFQVVERYYEQHKDELDAYERRVQEYRSEQVRLQRLRLPEREDECQERLAQLRRLLQRRREESKVERARG